MPIPDHAASQMMFWIPITVVVLLTVAFITDRLRHRPSVTPHAHASMAPQTVWESVPEEVRRARARSVSTAIFAAMEEVAKGDERSEVLATRFYTSAIPAYLDPGGRIMSAQRVRFQEESFFLVVASSREYAAVGQPQKATFSFVGEERSFYFVTDNPLSERVLGVAALHEAVHWDDVRGKWEQARARGREWVRGEVRAHTMENLALNRLSGGGFFREIQAVIADPSATNEFRPGWSTRVPNDQGILRLLTALGFPFVSKKDADLMTAAVLIAVIIGQGENEEQQISLLDEFYKQKNTAH